MKRLVLATVLTALAAPALAETTLCTNITSLPATITVPGVYCLKQDLNTSMTSGNAITIAANSVTIDFNGYKLGGLTGGPATTARGVSADNRKNITLRNGNIRGFFIGISVDQTTAGSSSGHLIEGNLLDGNRDAGISVRGSGIVVRKNSVVNTGGNNVIRAIAGGDLLSSQIVDNFVSGVTASADAYGILIDGASDKVEVARNTVQNIQGASFASGLENQSASSGLVLFKDNVATLGTAGTNFAVGIVGYMGVSLCLNNIVSGFEDGQTSGCASEAGTFPGP